MGLVTGSVAMLVAIVSPGYVTGCNEAPLNNCEPNEARYDKAQERIETIKEQYLIEEDEGTLQIDLKLAMVRRYDVSTPASWVTSAYATPACDDNAQLRIDAVLDVTWTPTVGEPLILAEAIEMDGNYYENSDWGTLTLQDFELRQWSIDMLCANATGCKLSLSALTPLDKDLADSERTPWLEINDEDLTKFEPSRRNSR